MHKYQNLLKRFAEVHYQLKERSFEQNKQQKQESLYLTKQIDKQRKQLETNSKESTERLERQKNEYLTLQQQYQMIINEKSNFEVYLLEVTKKYQDQQQKLFMLQNQNQERDQYQNQSTQNYQSYLESKLEESTKKYLEQYQKLILLKNQHEQLDKQLFQSYSIYLSMEKKYKEYSSAQGEEILRLKKEHKTLLSQEIKEKQIQKDIAQVEEIKKSELIKQLEKQWIDIYTRDENIKKKLNEIISINNKTQNSISLDQEQDKLNELQLICQEYKDVYDQVQKYEQLLRRKLDTVLQIETKQIIDEMLKILLYNKSIIEKIFTLIKQMIESEKELISQNTILNDENELLKVKAQELTTLLEKQGPAMKDLRTVFLLHEFKPKQQVKIESQDKACSVYFKDRKMQEELLSRLNKINTDLQTLEQFQKNDEIYLRLFLKDQQ